MSLFYVYMRWVRERDNNRGEKCRHLLTFESRYVADEFYRAIQTQLRTNNRALLFPILERDTAQFWRYDYEGDANNAIAETLRNVRLPDTVQGRVMSALLPEAGGRGWAVAPVQAGKDWLHNRWYFIRNIRDPSLYWVSRGNNRIEVSDSQRTKFRIRGTEFRNDERKVLIRSDKIRIELPADSAPAPTFVSKMVDNNVVLAPDSGAWAFKFGDLLGNFGTSWDIPPGAEEVREFLTWSDNGDLDDWELC